VTLGRDEIDALVATGWLRESDTADRSKVGLAIGEALRDLVALGKH
jgi:hypothetical protein